MTKDLDLDKRGVDGGSLVPVIYAGQEQGETLDVVIQDSTSRILTVHLSNNLKTDITLTSDGAVSDGTVEVSAGHGFTAGSYIEIYEGAKWYQAQVLSVATNTITLAIPLDQIFTTSSTVYRVSINMEVDGSVTPVIFNWSPPPLLSIDVTRWIWTVLMGGAGDGGLYGNLPELNNGTYIRKLNSSTNTQNLGNFRSNQDVIDHTFDKDYDDRGSGGGLYSFSARKTYGGQSKHGAVVRLHGIHTDHFEAVVRDNLSTLTDHRVTLGGSVVID